MTKVKMTLTAVMALGASTVVAVQARADQWAPTNIKATLANLKEVAAKSAKENPVKAVRAAKPKGTPVAPGVYIPDNISDRTYLACVCEYQAPNGDKYYSLNGTYRVVWDGTLNDDNIQYFSAADKADGKTACEDVLAQLRAKNICPKEPKSGGK